MQCKVEELRYLSSDGEHNIYAKIYIPNGEPKGIVQICHGMNGYIGKYDEVATRLTDEGYVVCGNTHLGHKESMNNESEFGFFGEFNGSRYLIDDVYKMTEIIKEKYPNLKLFLLGHSMGSFIARCYLYEHSDKVSGIIISGTAGPNYLNDSGIIFLNSVIEKRGYHFRSEKLYSILFKAANRRIDNPKNNYAWVSKSAEEFVSSLMKSLFTVTGLRDVLILIDECNDYHKICKLPSKLPVFFFSGSEDPLGQYGEGVKRAAKLYQKAGLNDVTVNIYNGCRHECLSDEKKDIVINDIINWINVRNI